MSGYSVGYRVGFQRGLQLRRSCGVDFLRKHKSPVLPTLQGMSECACLCI